MNHYEYKVKRENPNDEFVIIGSWDIQNGKKVSAGDIICSLEATKNTYDVEAESDGYVFYERSEGDRVEVGNLLFVITPNADFTFEKSKTNTSSGEQKITRKAQKLIEEYGIDIQDLNALSGRIGENEIREFARTKKLSLKSESIQESIIPAEDEDLSGAKAFEVHFMNQNRDVIYSRVSREIDYSVVEHILIKNKGTTLGEVVSFAMANAITKFPYVNSTFLKNNKIRKYKEINLGLAINIGKGLKVPVIKNFNELDLNSVSARFKELSMSYVRDELNGNDLFGATLTVTDLSSLGVKDFLPVVSKDQGAILGICSRMPSTNTFNLTLGFDHRLMDGMYAAQFLKAIEDHMKKIQ